MANKVNFTVEVRNDNVEGAMSLMKRKFLKEGFFKELRRRQNFEKGSEKRIRKAKEYLANTHKKRKMRDKFGGPSSPSTPFIRNKDQYKRTTQICQSQ